jgi:hypothetical protein
VISKGLRASRPHTVSSDSAAGSSQAGFLGEGSKASEVKVMCWMLKDVRKRE